MQFLDMVTVLTVGGILAILVLYLVIVYKKGWLKRDSRQSESYFLCPNSKCRRVFKDPVWLTDLSKTPPESYQACPHCSVSLQTSPSFSVKASSELVSTPTAPPLGKGFKELDERTHYVQKETVPKKKAAVTGVPTHTFQTNVSKSPEKSTAPQQPKSPTPTVEIRKEIPSKPIETPKKQDEKSVSERPRACSHYFGYVKTLPKNTSIPDECLWCPWIVKCLTGTETIEA